MKRRSLVLGIAVLVSIGCSSSSGRSATSASTSSTDLRSAEHSDFLREIQNTAPTAAEAGDRAVVIGSQICAAVLRLGTHATTEDAQAAVERILSRNTDVVPTTESAEFATSATDNLCPQVAALLE